MERDNKRKKKKKDSREDRSFFGKRKRIGFWKGLKEKEDLKGIDLPQDDLLRLSGDELYKALIKSAMKGEREESKERESKIEKEDDELDEEIDIKISDLFYERLEDEGEKGEEVEALKEEEEEKDEAESIDEKISEETIEPPVEDREERISEPIEEEKESEDYNETIYQEEERRKDQRIYFKCFIYYRKMGNLVKGEVLNIGQGGAFIKTSKLLPIKSQHHFVLLFPDRKTIKVKGRVVWASPVNPFSFHSIVSGMGIEFIYEDSKVKEEIEKALFHDYGMV